MKNLITAAAVFLSLGTSAFAMVADGPLSASDAMEARRYVPGADFSGLTAAQANIIANAIYSDDDHVGGLIRSILLQN